MKVVIANGDKAYQIKTDKKKITHESWQQFKKNGWVKV